MNFTTGALFGYSSENSIESLKMPPSQIVPSGPNITAFHCIMFSARGHAFTPSGGSDWRPANDGKIIREYFKEERAVWRRQIKMQILQKQFMSPRAICISARLKSRMRRFRAGVVILTSLTSPEEGLDQFCTKVIPRMKQRVGWELAIETKSFWGYK